MSFSREKETCDAGDVAQEFQPPPLLSHYHLQTTLASIGPRRYFVKRRAKRLLDNATSEIIACQDDVRLSGEYSESIAKDNHSLVILLHGWEGCMTSSYILSAGAKLYDEGHSIFRLNFRDHGDSHHLNKALFNSTRIKEVIEAISVVKERFPHRHICLAGFSLGGNFALRIAGLASDYNILLDKIVGVCPLISPFNTTFDIEAGLCVYHYYFMRRWKRSLAKKMALFPEYNYADALKKSRSLSQLNQYFVPNHTPYQEPSDYLNAYGVYDETLASIKAPTHILVAEDDPIVQTRWFNRLNIPDQVDVNITRQGGHCGFIKDWAFNSYADDWLVAKLSFR